MDLANDLKSLLVTLLLFVASSASAQTQDQVKSPDEMTRSEVVVNIVSWEAVIANYDTYHNLLSQFPEDRSTILLQELDTAYNQAVRTLDQLRVVAKRQYTASELTPEINNARVLQLESDISQYQEMVSSLAQAPDISTQLLRTNIIKKKNQLRVLKNKIKTTKNIAQKAAIDILGSLEDREPMIPSSSLMGVAFKRGTMGTRFDYTSGFSIPVFRGGGVFLVLEDGSAIKDSGAPSDLNIQKFKEENPSSVKRLEDLDVAENYLFPPLKRGYTLDIYARDDTPGVGGPTLSGLRLTKDGLFEKSSTKITTTGDVGGVYGRNTTSDNLSGTYFIDGNTIELQYYDGRLIRKLFGTDGKSVVILGKREYKVSEK